VEVKDGDKDGDKERPKLEIDTHRAATVASIFKGVIQGKGLKEIVKELNSSEIAAPKGKSWGKTTIHMILTNEAYTGTFIWGRNGKRNLSPVRMENAWPTIIDKETFDKVQAQLKDLAPAQLNPRRAASPYLLSGIARCGHCDKALGGQEAKGGKFSYYICSTLLGRGRAPARLITSIARNLKGWW
jgi:site-specific DNA recombinase